MALATKRRGRPRKAPKAGNRAPLSLLVRPALKRRIDDLTRVSGRTMSAEAESLIERCLVYDDTMQAMRTTLAEMEKGNVEAALYRLGYPMQRQIINGKAWKTWFEPGFPGIERSGFMP